MTSPRVFLLLALVAACAPNSEALGTPPSGPSGLCELAVSPPSATLNVGEVLRLSARRCQVEAVVVWRSTDPARATVDQTGQVRAVALGQASIVAKWASDTTVIGSALIMVHQ